MKFGKKLKLQIDQSFPGWRDKFLSYKHLKKLLRFISSSSFPHSNGSLHCANPHPDPEAQFIYFLNNEIDKFNAFFMELEEDFVIRHKELPQRIEEAMDKWGPNGSHPSEPQFKQEMSKIRKDIVNFHGEMVLLINYSNINYTGLAKILKKYDKRTGGVLRLPFIQKVLKQPFFTTDLISKLVKECESTIESIFPPSSWKSCKEKEGMAPVLAGEGVFRNTVAALLTMHEMRRGTSTYSHLSLPPLNLPDFDFDFDVDVIQSLQAAPPIQIP